MIYPQAEFRPYEQKYDDVQRIKLNKNYIWPLGVLRGFIIISCLGGVISAGIIPTDNVAFYALNSSFPQTRAALIAMFAIAFWISAVIFTVSMSNFVNLPGVQSVWWLISFCIFDGLFFLGFVVIGIIAATKETAAQSLNPNPILLGTYAASSFFALFSALLMAISVGISVPYIIRLREFD